MKKFFLLFFGISVFLVQAQQASVMQPAIKNSHKKLDSVYLSGGDIIRTNNSLEGLTEKWIVKEYDVDKNPTKFMVYHYQNPYTPVIVDSLRVTLEHYPINNYITDFRNSLYGLYRQYEYVNSPIYNLFNIKSVTEEIYNTNTNQWISSYYVDSYNDLRYPDALNLNYMEYGYDENFSITFISKKESTIEDQGYIQDQTYFNWDVIDGFTPNYKFNYYNNYYTNGKLQESIKKRINDIETGVEINISKQNYFYGTDFFEYTKQEWNDVTNNWDMPLYKYRTVYINGTPNIKISYRWINDNWVDQTDITTPTYHFNNGIFYGSSDIIPTIGSGSHDLTYNNDNLIISESSGFINEDPANASGYFEEKEFYYSSDGTNAVSNYNLSNITLSPNPAKNSISINSETELTYDIYSIQGKKLLNGHTSSSIDISKLQTGIYFIKFKTENGFINKQFIIK